MALSSPSKVIPLSVGGYRMIGRAGIGVSAVHRARDPEDNLVAVYLFPPNEKELIARLGATFDSLLGIEHPNILRVLDWGCEGDHGYLATEWVEGTTLARMIEIHSRLPEANVVRFLAQVGQAMDYARRGEEALCRINPANVLIRSDGLAKVIPFELPRDEFKLPPPPPPPKPVSRTGLVIAEPTPPPVAKEEPLGGPVPFAELIFSLGTTLHEALTGAEWTPPPPPPPGRRRRPPPRPAGLSDRTERVIRRATDADPAKRPANCADLLKLLRTRPLTAGTPKSDVRPAGATENRRGFIRYSLGVGSNCTINASAVDGAHPSSEVWPLVVQDVSVTGIGLLIARRCEPGTVLSVEAGSGASRAALPVRVVRVRKDNFGHWVHGCAFLTPLAEHELYGLVEQLGRNDVA